MVDLRYLHEVAIPAHDAARDGTKFRAAVSKLEADLTEFDEVMRKVESGEVSVYRNRNRGAWESTVEEKQRWVSVDYAGKLGPVQQFRIHPQGGGSDPDYCIGEFGPNGYLSRADLPDYDFKFDDAGRVQK